MSSHQHVLAPAGQDLSFDSRDVSFHDRAGIAYKVFTVSVNVTEQHELAKVVLSYGCLCSRAAEDELMTVADEKDKLAPQLEEARWHNRQLEKDVQQLQETSSGQKQVICS